MNQTLQTLVTHTAWANRQLFGALRSVDAFATRPCADLIRRALDHIHVVRCIFRAHLEGVAHDFTAPQRAILPSLEELDREFEAIDAWYVDAVAALPPADPRRDVRFTDGKILAMTATEMVLHVVTHTIHHRGNIDVLMLQTGLPRRRDGFPEFVTATA